MTPKELAAIFDTNTKGMAEILCTSRQNLYNLLSGTIKPQANKLKFYEAQLKIISNEKTKEDIENAITKAKKREEAIQKLVNKYKE